MREQFLGFEQHIAWGRGRKWEVDHSVNVHAFHLKDHTVDRHTKDFRLAKLVKVVLEHCRGVEPITMPRTSSSGTTRSLCCGSFRDPAHLEGLDAVVQVVASLQKWLRLAPYSDAQTTTLPLLPSHSPPRIGYSGW